MAKALSPQMSTILKKVGADQVINPEAESGIRTARALASPTILDLFDVGENLCMIEMVPDKKWIGKTLLELDLRQKRGINVIAMKSSGNTWTYLDANSPILEDSTLLVVLEKKQLSLL
jgi:trk system potassium uptake protein TrkA